MGSRFKLSGVLILILLIHVNNATGGKPVTDTAHFYMKHSYDVLSYKLDLNLYSCYTFPYPDSFPAREVIRFRIDSTLSEIRLNAVSTSLFIDSVGLAGTGFTHTNDTLTISLDRTYNPGETAEVRILYRHNKYFDHAFYSAGGFVYTDCPPEGARKWFPCWDRPSDKATTDITVKVPLAVRLGSTGLLADSTITGDSLYYHWVSRDPVATYLVTVSSKTDFNVWKQYYPKYSNPSDSIPVRFYYQDGQNIANISQLVKPLTDFFSSLFGDYPFEKIGFAALNSNFPWGGMENQTMVNLYPGTFGDNQLIAHEHSHQWFGDMITCGTWADIWLNEGFGTYCQVLWAGNESGYTAYKSNLYSYASNYLAADPEFAIYNPQWAINTPNINYLYNTPVIYHKSACVLHQLRYVLGDSVFFRVLKDYASDTNFRFKNAVTLDFIDKVNQVSGLNMQWFFDEWVYKSHHPVYENTYDIIDKGNGEWEVNLKVSQVQTNTVFFTMPVEIRIQFSDLSDTLIRVLNNTNNQFFNFTFSKQPSILIFDPDNNILLKKATTALGIEKKTEDRGYRLFQNEPNPFSGSSLIYYQVPRSTHVRIIILDPTGKIIRTLVDERIPKGLNHVQFSSGQLPAGIYLVRMESDHFSDTQRMILLK